MSEMPNTLGEVRVLGRSHGQISECALTDHYLFMLSVAFWFGDRVQLPMEYPVNGVTRIVVWQTIFEAGHQGHYADNLGGNDFTSQASWPLHGMGQSLDKQGLTLKKQNVKIRTSFARRISSTGKFLEF